MGVYSVRTRLPAAHTAQIGRFITRWAFLESKLRQVSYTMLQLSPKIGRLLVREPRAVDYVTMLEDAMSVMGLTTSIDLKNLKSGLGTLESFRDKLAHGVWVRHTKTAIPVLQDFSGKHPAGPEQGQKARIHPKGTAITATNIKDWATGTTNASKLILKWRAEILRQLRASPCRCCGQPLRRRTARRGNQSSAAHQPQLRP